MLGKLIRLRSENCFMSEECPPPDDILQAMAEQNLFISYKHYRNISYFTRQIQLIYEQNSRGYQGLARGDDYHTRYDPIVASFIVLASRKIGLPYSGEEIRKFFDWEYGGETARFFLNVLRRIQAVVEGHTRLLFNRDTPSNYANRWLHQIQMTDATRGLIQKNLEEIEAANPESTLGQIRNTRSVPGIAAAVIYGVCRNSLEVEDKYTQDQIEVATCVTTVTLRDIVDDFAEQGVFDFERYVDYDPLSYGNVYIVSNPLFPNMLKFGKSGNPTRSYASLGRYNPLHRYTVEWVFPCLNSAVVEDSVLESLRIEYSQPDFGNEWFIHVDVESMKNLIIQNPTYQDNRRLNPIQP